jgi:hypothetical protein
MRVGFGPSCSAPQKVCYIFIILYFFLTSLIVNVTRRKSSSSTFSTKASRTRRGRNHTFIGVISCSAYFQCHTHMPSTKSHPRLCDFVFGDAFLSMPHLPDTPNTKRHHHWCLFVFGVILSPSTHAEHEKTPLLVSFHVRCLSFILYNTRRAQKRTLVGVFCHFRIF